MRRICILAFVALLSLSLPAQAEVTTSLQAAQALQSALGPGKTIGGGEGPDVIIALNQAAAAHPEMLAEMAALIAVARPDLMDDLKDAIKKLNPASADSIIKQVEQASINPSIDSLAALANLEGIAPAADSPTDSPKDSNPSNTDLGWADDAADHNGSPN